MSKIVDRGQDSKFWGRFWENQNPLSEIRMWDFYGGRQWITKFTPRFGKVIEAGCGLGRYVFYLSKMGIDIEGIDFESNLISYLNEWGKEQSLNTNFRVGNILALPYEDNSLSGYISLGVLEHFIEGPHIALKEAYRVLRPGGVAIITTPNKSYSVLFNDIKEVLSKLKRAVLRQKKKAKIFEQYWYSPKKLRHFLTQDKFTVTKSEVCDFPYTLVEMNINLGKSKIAQHIANYGEKSFLRKFGAQSITISVKKAEKMYCFFCNELNVKVETLKNYSVPVCTDCQNKEQTKYYYNSYVTKFCNEYIFEKNIQEIREEMCDNCGVLYKCSDIFDNFGFSKRICESCLKIPLINIEYSNNNLLPIWRKRISND